MCAETVTAAEVVILDLDISASSNRHIAQPILSVQNPYVFFDFSTSLKHDRFTFSTTATVSTPPPPTPPTTTTAPALAPSVTVCSTPYTGSINLNNNDNANSTLNMQHYHHPSPLQQSQCTRKRSRPYGTDSDEYERPGKRRRLRLQIAFSGLSKPYSSPSLQSGFASHEAIVMKPGFQTRGKMPKLKGDVFRKTAIMNKIRKDGLCGGSCADGVKVDESEEQRKADILRRHRLIFESYQSDPLRNQPPSADVLEARWAADDMPSRYDEPEDYEYEEYAWHLFV